MIAVSLGLVNTTTTEEPQTMTGIAYLAAGPAGTPYSRVRLRIHAMSPKDSLRPQDLRVTVQSVDRDGPIVESPVHVEWMSPLGLAAYLSQSIREGWDIVPDPIPEANHRSRA